MKNSDEAGVYYTVFKHDKGDDWYKVGKIDHRGTVAFDNS